MIFPGKKAKSFSFGAARFYAPDPRAKSIFLGGEGVNFKLDIAKLFMWRKQLCAASAYDINSNLPAVCFRLFNKALPCRC